MRHDRAPSRDALYERIYPDWTTSQAAAVRDALERNPTWVAVLDEMRARGLDLATVATGGDPGHAPARAAYEQAGFTPFPQVWYSQRLDG